MSCRCTNTGKHSQQNLTKNRTKNGAPIRSRSETSTSIAINASEMLLTRWIYSEIARLPFELNEDEYEVGECVQQRHLQNDVQDLAIAPEITQINCKRNDMFKNGWIKPDENVKLIFLILDLKRWIWSTSTITRWIEKNLQWTYFSIVGSWFSRTRIRLIGMQLPQKFGHGLDSFEQRWTNGEAVPPSSCSGTVAEVQTTSLEWLCLFRKTWNLFRV